MRRRSCGSWSTSSWTRTTAGTPSLAWSGPKGWAYTEDAVWGNPEVLGTTVPGSFNPGVWQQAVDVVERLDPHRVFGNGFQDRSLRPLGHASPRRPPGAERVTSAGISHQTRTWSTRGPLTLFPAVDNAASGTMAVSPM